MSFLATTTRKDHRIGPSWAGSAFVVEAIVLLAFLAASSAVFVQLFSAASLRADESSTTAAAVAAASSTAERFVADPSSVPEVAQFDDLVAVCKTRSTPRTGGTMYYADITIYKYRGEPLEADTGSISAAQFTADEQDAVYAISTSVYVSKVSG